MPVEEEREGNFTREWKLAPPSLFRDSFVVFGFHVKEG